jgi:hypothetical protein
MRSAVLGMLTLLAVPMWALAQASFIPVQSGTPVSTSIQGSSLTSSYVVDVAEGQRSLRVELRGGDPTRDLDLLIRYGSPFDIRAGEAIDVNQLFDQAHYRSASSGGDEYVLIDQSNGIPLRAGRWYLLLINFDANQVPMTLSATASSTVPVAAIEMIFNDPGTSERPCDLSGWNATEVRSPVGGNTGTSLGEQRRLAAEEAARQLTLQLSPRVPVRVQACWEDLGDASGNRFTLAKAGPSYLFLNDVGLSGLSVPSLERSYTWYSAAAAAQQIGTTVCRLDGGLDCATAADVRASFNSTLDKPGAAAFDYSLAQTTNSLSFVSVAMHEITHGLGFFGLINTSTEDGGVLGAKEQLVRDGALYDDIYGAHVREVSSDGLVTREFLRISDAERAQALVSEPQLRFAGPNAVLAGPLAQSPAPTSYISLHAPLELSAGSTYSHIAGNRYGVQLMTALLSSNGPRSLGIGAGVLRDLGWSDAAKPARRFASAPSFQYFDPTRNGHGIDFRLISPAIAGREAEYFLGFYTYDASGEPEWYIASGPLIDGVFVPKANSFGDSLLRQRYLGPDRSEADSSAGYAGRVRIDFNNAQLHPACADGNPGRVLDGPLAVMTTTINGERLQWCMQPVVLPMRVNNDFSSIWYSLGDGGWGMALQSFDGTGRDGLFSVLFYSDAQGKPRWAVAQVDAFTPGTPQPLAQLRGYCRTCPSPPSLQLSPPIGSVTLDLVRGGAGASGNRVSVDVTYPGPEGGRFIRSSVALFPNSDPTLSGN